LSWTRTFEERENHQQPKWLVGAWTKLPSPGGEGAAVTKIADNRKLPATILDLLWKKQMRAERATSRRCGASPKVEPEAKASTCPKV